MNKEHLYKLKIKWTGNEGKGTADYFSYKRSYEIAIEGKQIIQGSSDPSFRGDRARYNPEELFLASISSCHMLWYLHLCAVNKINVVDYVDNPIGRMEEQMSGSGKFVEVTLNPIVTILKQNSAAQAEDLHKEANKKCFVSNSCNFPILHKPVIKTE